MKAQHPIQIGAPLQSDLIPKLQWIEVSCSFQIPSFIIVGLPGPEVSEAKERVKAAIEASGLEFPRQRVVLNLSPAHVKKQGTGLDLAMALAVLASQMNATQPLACIAWGELGLNGSIKSTGQLTRTLYACWRGEIRYLFIPASQFQNFDSQVKLLEKSADLKGPPPQAIPVENLADAWNALETLSMGHELENSLRLGFSTQTLAEPDLEPADLLPLSPSLERILGIAASGVHHLLLLGPKGVGKTQAMNWLTAILPSASSDTLVMQALLSEMTLSDIPATRLPIRRISSNARPASLIGSAPSHSIRPGEFSLAHGGLLIADEMPEWARDTRESLREPLERGWVTLTRTKGSMELPARFQLAANGNFCPCGGWPTSIPMNSSSPVSITSVRKCKCSHKVKEDYLKRLSGPILDRIDLVHKLPPHIPDSKNGLNKGLSSLREKVVQSREKTHRRWGNSPGLLSAIELETIFSLFPEWATWTRSFEGGSLRSRHKILRVALSLAAWDGAELPSHEHFVEASFYRPEQQGLI